MVKSELAMALYKGKYVDLQKSKNKRSDHFTATITW